jgi:MFS family permease
MTASFWGMMPVYIEDIGLQPRHLSIVLSVGVLAGLIVQLPTGWLADHIGRRPLILAQSVLGAAVALAIVFFGARSFELLVVLAFLFCLMIGPLYALGVAQTNDYISSREFVAASSGLLFAWGIGSSTGPTIAAAIISVVGGQGLFLFLAASLAAIAALVVVRMRKRPPLPRPAPFVAVPATAETYGAPELDPRSEPAPTREPEEAR